MLLFVTFYIFRQLFDDDMGFKVAGHQRHTGAIVI